MQWWKTLYEQRFLDWEGWAVPDANITKKQIQYFLLATNLTPSKSILDLGAGVGMHVAYLQSQGFKAIGLEYSTTLVQRGLALNPTINLIVGDMRKYNPTHKIDAITYFDTSFGIFDDKSNMKLLKSNYNILSEGGVLLIDYMNPDYWKNITEEIVIEDYKEKGGKLVRNYSYNEKSNKLIDCAVYILPSGKTVKYPDQILSLYKTELLEQILEDIGFSSIHSYGSDGFVYPNVLTSVKNTSAFVQVTCQRP